MVERSVGTQAGQRAVGVGLFPFPAALWLRTEAPQPLAGLADAALQLRFGVAPDIDDVLVRFSRALAVAQPLVDPAPFERPQHTEGSLVVVAALIEERRCLVVPI